MICSLKSNYGRCVLRLIVYFINKYPWRYLLVPMCSLIQKNSVIREWESAAVCCIKHTCLVPLAWLLSALSPMFEISTTSLHTWYLALWMDTPFLANPDSWDGWATRCWNNKLWTFWFSVLQPKSFSAQRPSCSYSILKSICYWRRLWRCHRSTANELSQNIRRQNMVTLFKIFRKLGPQTKHFDMTSLHKALCSYSYKLFVQMCYFGNLFFLPFPVSLGAAFS